MKTTTEAKIQQDCYMWFANNYARHGKGIMFSVPNENIGSQHKKVNTGLLKGVSDAIIVLPNKVLFVEFKTPTGVISPSQKDFKNKITLLGQEYFIVRTLEDFKTLILANFT